MKARDHVCGWLAGVPAQMRNVCVGLAAIRSRGAQGTGFKKEMTGVCSKPVDEVAPSSGGLERAYCRFSFSTV